MGGAAMSAAPHIPSAAADPCPDIEVMFARGTNDPPGPGGVGQAFIDSLRSKVGGRSVGQYAVNYAANMNFLRVADGVADANGHVMYMVGNCPATRLVLGGYSQGAAVVDFMAGAAPNLGAIPGVGAIPAIPGVGAIPAIPGVGAIPPIPGVGAIPGLDAVPGLNLGGAVPLPAEAADHVAAVAVFGNPLDKLQGSLNALSPVYGGRTIDLCNAGDPICGPGDLDNRGPHHQYVPGRTDQAAAFVAGLL
jgi:cutinase